MFMPTLRPSQLLGNVIPLQGAFLGVSIVKIEDRIFAGPLIREGQRIFVLHASTAETGEPGYTAQIRFVEIGANGTHQVLDQATQITVLTERVNEDKAAISSMRQIIDNLESVETYMLARETLHLERICALEFLLADALLASVKDGSIAPRTGNIPFLVAAALLAAVNPAVENIDSPQLPLFPDPPPVVDPEKAILLEGSITDHAWARLTLEESDMERARR